MTLNSSQLKAVELDAPLIVVPSGPGSGKTRVGVMRGRRLARAKHKVVVLTYTNSAANEYRRRILDCGTTGVHQVCENLTVDFCGTLHSYCFKVVRQFGYKIGYAHGNVGILPESDQEDLLREVRRRLGFEALSLPFILNHKFDEPRAQQVWKEYLFLLKRNNLVDYDRILLDAFLLLADQEVRHELRIDDLIVDEAQDSAAIDWSIYHAIPASSRFYIGDIDQAIFEFRGAYPKGFLEEAKGAEIIKLEDNYRCAAAICRAANALIRHNENRFDKDTIAVTSDEGEVTVTVRDDPWSELNWMADKMIKLRTGTSMAVLCRTNHEVQRTFDYLRSNTSLPIHAGYEFQRTPPDWHRALLLIGLEASPYNEILAERFLRLDHDSSLVDRWKIEGQARGEYLTDRIKGAPPTNNMHELLEYLALHGVGQETIYAIKARMALMAEDSSILDLLQDLNANQRTESAPTGAVYVGTIHSAKGREFDVVFLPAFEELGCETNPEEERRLAFVALTRARRAVHISWSKQRKPKWGETIEPEPSRFIAEMNL